MNSCFHESAPSLVSEFFASRLQLAVGYRFKGILWVPNEFKNCPMDMDHVAVAAGFDGWIGKTCLMHVVIQKPELLNREMIREAFTYVFDTCGVNYVIGMVDSGNLPAVEFDQRIGFQEVHRISNGGIDGVTDMIVFGMRKQDCRWVTKEIRNGEKRSGSP